ncbi:MAG: hypothetical protein QOE56_1370 [Solirubrobacterales bacterium]|nr:hypothetical protein [Solirubrobacterales bacterium]
MGYLTIHFPVQRLPQAFHQWFEELLDIRIGRLGFDGGKGVESRFADGKMIGAGEG